MKKTYVLTLDDDDSIYAEPNLREKIYLELASNCLKMI